MSEIKPEIESWDYQATVREIEAIIEEIERGNLPLEELFAEFAVAVEKLRRCETFLERGKEQMNLLIETLEDSG